MKKQKVIFNGKYKSKYLCAKILSSHYKGNPPLKQTPYTADTALRFIFTLNQCGQHLFFKESLTRIPSETSKKSEATVFWHCAPV